MTDLSDHLSSFADLLFSTGIAMELVGAASQLPTGSSQHVLAMYGIVAVWQILIVRGPLTTVVDWTAERIENHFEVSADA